MTKIYFKGLNSPKERTVAARLAKDIATNGIEDVERRARNYPKLEHRAGELEVENKELECRVGSLESNLARVNKLERVCDLLLAKMDTQNQKFIYYKGDDNNSVGKLVGIGSKREGTSTLYPYVVE